MLSSDCVLKSVNRPLGLGLPLEASFPRFLLYFAVFVPFHTFSQRNFAEIVRSGVQMTAKLWLEVRHKNNEFSECVCDLLLSTALCLKKFKVHLQL